MDPVRSDALNPAPGGPGTVSHSAQPELDRRLNGQPPGVFTLGMWLWDTTNPPPSQSHHRNVTCEAGAAGVGRVVLSARCRTRRVVATADALGPGRM